MIAPLPSLLGCGWVVRVASQPILDDVVIELLRPEHSRKTLAHYVLGICGKIPRNDRCVKIHRPHVAGARTFCRRRRTGVRSFEARVGKSTGPLAVSTISPPEQHLSEDSPPRRDKPTEADQGKANERRSQEKARPPSPREIPGRSRTGWTFRPLAQGCKRSFCIKHRSRTLRHACVRSTSTNGRNVQPVLERPGIYGVTVDEPSPGSDARWLCLGQPQWVYLVESGVLTHCCSGRRNRATAGACQLARRGAKEATPV